MRLEVRRRYDDGREDGFEDGRAEGYEAGRAEGCEEGKAEGLHMGRIEGLASGRLAGFDEGRQTGYEDGFKDGYERGRKDERVHALEAFDKFMDKGADQRSVTSVVSTLDTNMRRLSSQLNEQFRTKEIVFTDGWREFATFLRLNRAILDLRLRSIFGRPLRAPSLFRSLLPFLYQCGYIASPDSRHLCPSFALNLPILRLDKTHAHDRCLHAVRSALI